MALILLFWRRKVVAPGYLGDVPIAYIVLRDGVLLFLATCGQFCSHPTEHALISWPCRNHCGGHGICHEESSSYIYDPVSIHVNEITSPIDLLLQRTKCDAIHRRWSSFRYAILLAF